MVYIPFNLIWMTIISTTVGKPFNITVIQLYAPTTEEAEAEWFYEDLQDRLE